MLGFELDLYSTGEYCMVYWYMYIILIKLAEKTHTRTMTSNEISKNAACSNHLFSLVVGVSLLNRQSGSTSLVTLYVDF